MLMGEVRIVPVTRSQMDLVWIVSCVSRAGVNRSSSSFVTFVVGFKTREKTREVKPSSNMENSEVTITEMKLHCCHPLRAPLYM